jgi:hypothetical protein
VSDAPEVFGFRREDKDSLLGLIDGRRGTRVPPRNTAGDGHRILLVRAVAQINAGAVGEVQVLRSDNGGVTLNVDATLNDEDYRFDALNLGPKVLENEKRIAIREECSGSWLLVFAIDSFDVRWRSTGPGTGVFEKTKDGGDNWLNVASGEVCE